MENFKKDDQAYIIVKKMAGAFDGDTFIVPCKIEKLTKENYLKAWNKKQIRKKCLKVDPDYNNTRNYPLEVAWIVYDFNGKHYEKWEYTDILKKDPKDFFVSLNNIRNES